MASLEAIVVPIQNEFVLSVDDIATLVLTVAAGSLLILFAAGALVDRLGPRRIFTAGAVISVVGAATVGLAADYGWLVAGRIIGGAGGTVLSVASLAIVNATFSDDRERAHVFGLFAAVVGAAFVVSPLVAGVIAESLGWRWVPLAWMAVAATAVLCLRSCPVPAGVGDGRGELVLPLAAGAMLSAVCVAALVVRGGVGWSLLSLAVAAIALALLMVRWRTLRAAGTTPAFDVSMFAVPGAKPLMGAMFVVAMVNLLFYANLFVQYRLGFTPVESARLFVIPQVAGVLGGVTGGWISARRGSLRTTAGALILGGAAAAVFVTVTEQTSAGYLTVLLCLFTFAAGSLVGTLTKAFLDCAQPQSSGAAASWRQAGWSLGSTVGGVATGTIVFTYFSATWQATLRAEGLSGDAARWAAEAVRSGMPLTQVVADPGVTQLVGGSAIENLVGLTSAQVDTLRLVGLLAAGSYLVALACVLVAMRRQTVGSDD